MAEEMIEHGRTGVVELRFATLAEERAERHRPRGRRMACHARYCVSDRLSRGPRHGMTPLVQPGLFDNRALNHRQRSDDSNVAALFE